MFISEGKYNKAKVYTDLIDEASIKQINNLLNNEAFKDSRIRIMPDVHAGAGCVIGLSMTITDKIVPNLVGVDIGCGVMTAKLKEKDINFEKLDQTIRQFIPAGFDVRTEANENVREIPFDEVVCPIKRSRAELSVGTLGGGNHFISVERDEDGNHFLLIHSGSRHFGGEIAQYYQDLAVRNAETDNKLNNGEKERLIREMKEAGRAAEIQTVLKSLSVKRNLSEEEKDLAYLVKEEMQQYLHDMRIAQTFAYWNRFTMIQIIAREMNFHLEDVFDTIHNYINFKDMVLRKGAVSAHRDERLIIPINMRDGSIIAIGKGNEEWNCTSPHGAGRLYSRSEAKKHFSMAEFRQSMAGIYTTSVNDSTLDESPMSYKPIDSILNAIGETVTIQSLIKPVYNFKAN